MNMLIKMSDAKEIEQLREVFNSIDTDRSGMISKQELTDAMKSNKLSMTDQQIKSIINEVDYFGNDEINYTEFLVATLDARTLMDDQNLHAIFQNFDTD